uniref:Protein aurora borealis n=1 Tax=Myripristis murdjan TaxID=586833 RepID=A0A667WUR6_9TELE
MGDRVELQITPETPGRPSIRNPFESPTDYHRLHEPLVPSPSVFKSKPCKATPVKFNWSIDEMASLLPVHIDPEDIQRQSFYLSKTRIDSDIEEKRQNAIEEFFTKGAIVPSPWAAPDIRKASQISKKKSISPLITEEPEKLTVACQTTLSLPVTFDLEKILGEYYCCEEVCEAVQESLSSSSLRRKLFLDGQGSISSGSDNSSPPSPEREPSREQKLSLVFPSICSSPLSCGITTQTPSTGQFSSSPIQHGRFRDCSLGSITSPLVPDRSSPAGLLSPTLSPIGAQSAHTPQGSAERKQLSFLTPDDVPLDLNVTSCTESPFVEGCSPIRSYSPARPKPRPRVRCWASPPLISPILNPKLQDCQELEDHSPSNSLPSMELDLSPSPAQDIHPINAESHQCLNGLGEGAGLKPLEPVKMEEGTETLMNGRLENIIEDEEEEEPEGLSAQLTSSRMVNVSVADFSQISVSLLAEGSSIRYDSSMQVDSGYNTTSAGAASLIDGFSSDCHSKESFSSNLAEEPFPFTRHTKVKVLYPLH